MGGSLQFLSQEGSLPINDSQTPSSLQKRQFWIILDSYATPSKTSRKVISDNKNVSSFKVM